MLRSHAWVIGALLAGTALSPFSANAGAIISNGVVQLGVRDLGNLNEPGGTPSNGDGTTVVGLRSVATNSDSTSPGCLCEGWGVGIVSLNASGFANASSGNGGLSLVSFTSTASTAKSVVDVISNGQTVLRVTHDYRPNAGTSALYQVDVSITNLSGQDLADGDLIYRRVMDWDIPTPGNEAVTIQGVPGALGVANGNNVRRTDNNGFNSSDPFTFSPFGLTNVNFTDAHGDIGALFDFEFEGLADGATRTFATYYGVAEDEAAADLARRLVDGDASDVDIGLYSYGNCRFGIANCDETTGTPNTFIFGFGAAGGVLEPPPDVDPPPTDNLPEPGALALLGSGLLGVLAVRRRRKA